MSRDDDKKPFWMRGLSERDALFVVDLLAWGCSTYCVLSIGSAFNENERFWDSELEQRPFRRVVWVILGSESNRLAVLFAAAAVMASAVVARCLFERDEVRESARRFLWAVVVGSAVAVVVLLFSTMS